MDFENGIGSKYIKSENGNIRRMNYTFHFLNVKIIGAFLPQSRLLSRFEN